MSTGGKARKNDAGKDRLELIPPEIIAALGRGLTFGAVKYAAGNWSLEPGLDHSRTFGALQRHLWAYWGGQDLDPESGLSHLDHAACMLAFLVASKERGFGQDDRADVGAMRRKVTDHNQDQGQISIPDPDGWL